MSDETKKGIIIVEAEDTNHNYFAANILWQERVSSDNIRVLGANNEIK